mgnify:CR=1 FL=1
MEGHEYNSIVLYFNLNKQKIRCPIRVFECCFNQLDCLLRMSKEYIL